MRNRLAPLASLLLVAAALAIGCGGPAAPPDPYELLATSARTAWNPVQVNVGFKITAGGSTITLDPKDIAVVVDTAASTFAFHMSLPAAGLGIPSSALDQIGIAGDSIDFDVLYAGDALYIKSALMKPMLRLFLGPTNKVPAGDLTGWLKLGTKADLMALAALSGGASGMPSFAPSSPGAKDIKASFDEIGVTLTTGAVEKHNGSDARHLTIAMDIQKLVSNPAFLQGAGPQSAPVIAAMKNFTFSGDLWVDPATNRVLEMDGHGASTSGAAAGTVDMTITAHDPDGSVPLAAPSTSVDVPIGTLITEMMKLIGRGAES